jgi:transketolase
LPDAAVIAGKSSAVFDYYGLNADGIVKAVMELIG